MPNAFTAFSSNSCEMQPPRMTVFAQGKQNQNYVLALYLRISYPNMPSLDFVVIPLRNRDTSKNTVSGFHDAACGCLSLEAMPYACHCAIIGNSRQCSSAGNSLHLGIARTGEERSLDKAAAIVSVETSPVPAFLLNSKNSFVHCTQLIW